MHWEKYEGLNPLISLHMCKVCRVCRVKFTVYAREKFLCGIGSKIHAYACVRETLHTLHTCPNASSGAAFDWQGDACTLRNPAQRSSLIILYPRHVTKNLALSPIILVPVIRVIDQEDLRL